MSATKNMKELYKKHVPVVLRRLRRSSGLRQDEMANLLGCGRSTYAHYETGTREMSISALLAVANALGVNAHELLPSTSSQEFSGANRSSLAAGSKKSQVTASNNPS